MEGRILKIALSLLGGLLTPILLFPLIAMGGAGNALTSSGGYLVLPIAVLFAASLVAWRPISPVVYAVALAIGFRVAASLVVGSHPGNMGGFVYFVTLLFGVSVAACALAVGMVIRWFDPPAYFPLIPAGLSVVLALGNCGSSFYMLKRHERNIVGRLQQLKQAEQNYAAARADHSFTCNGPDLPGLSDVVWRADAGTGGTQQNRSFIEGYWISLDCEWASLPHWFRISARPSWGGAPLAVDQTGVIYNGASSTRPYGPPGSSHRVGPATPPKREF